MGGMFGGGPKSPPPPPNPAQPAAGVGGASANIQEQALLNNAKGVDGTLATSPQGVLTQANTTAPKSLLGG